MRSLLVLLLLMPVAALAEIVTVDFVKVLNGNTDEAVYFYENNWKPYRAEAAKRGYISSYRLLVRRSDEGATNILLITGYASEAQYEDREANFAEVMSGSREGGPKLMNEKTPGEFREVVDGGVFFGE